MDLKPTATLLALTLTACETPAPPPPAAVETAPRPAAGEGIFIEIAAQSGLGHTHLSGMTGEFYYPEMMGSGAALFDYDNDGDLDVYLVQGGSLEEDAPPPVSDRLFRNDLTVDGDGRRVLAFTDVTAEAGLAAHGYGMGVAAADFDNDGWVDVYVTNLGANQLWRNNGAADGGPVTFTDVTAAAGAGDARWGVAAAVVDFDRDGWLDLYVGNYVEWSRGSNPRCSDELGLENYCGPLAFPPQGDTLLRHRGAGLAFDDVSRRAGVSEDYGGALGVVAADFDDDGWPDLYVGNDGLPNQLWINQRDGRFENRAVLAGCAVNAQGRPEASMGLSAADFDGDGDEDLFLTHLAAETNTVYVNDGHGLFEDRSLETGLASPSWSYTGFGNAWFDYDNDGWLDLLAVNGAVKVIKALALAGDPLPLDQPNQLFRNRGAAGMGADGGRVIFEDVTAAAGAALAASEVSRGAAFGDLDNDGDADAVVVNNNGPVRLLENRVGQDRHWLGLRLVVAAGGGERDAWGGRATVVRGDGSRLVRRVGAGASYASSSDPRLLFGLGSEPALERLLVRWPDGREEEFDVPEADRYTTLRQGAGRRGRR